MEVDAMLSEPDYGDETPGLIKPKKLINPVKESRRHQDMHRELLMKNKRGQGLQPKPELLRVLDQRKWEQRVGRQRHHLHHDEEPEPNAALQQELLKRFQRLEQTATSSSPARGGSSRVAVPAERPSPSSSACATTCAARASSPWRRSRARHDARGGRGGAPASTTRTTTVTTSGLGAAPRRGEP
ncbi:protein FAM107B-like isoform X1 [Lampetra fluviatilis]